MQGKTVVITGASSGIGLAGAEALARRGARLVLVGRDEARTVAALDLVRRAGPEADHAMHLADLSDLRETRGLGAMLAATEPRIDVLVNNAGALFARRILTRDGLEKTFALNHLSYVALARALAPSLAAAPSARIVNTASEAHRFGRLAWDNLQGERRYNGWAAYCASKLCNILFTQELARRLKGTQTTVTCFHPGFVASRFGGDPAGLQGLAFGLAKRLFAISPEEGAATLVYLASAPEVEGATGGYYGQRRPRRPSAAARSDADAARLWQISEDLLDRSASAPSRPRSTPGG